MEEEEYIEEHRRRIIEGRERLGRTGGRPRKEINVPIVLERLNQHVPMTEIAAGQHMSVQTLEKRMEEMGIIKEAAVYVLKEKKKDE